MYFVSLYWAIVTFTTTGYGDVSPANIVEVGFVTMTVILGSASFAFFMNSIGMILNDMSKQDNEFQKQLGLVNKYMSRNNINEELQFRVRQYLSYIMTIENVQNIAEEAKSIDQLNPQLREDIIIQTNGKIVNSCVIFAENFSEQVLRKLVMNLKQQRFIPGDYIYQIAS